MHGNLFNSRSVPAMISIDRWIEWTWLTRLRVSGENQRSADILELREIEGVDVDCRQRIRTC